MAIKERATAIYSALGLPLTIGLIAVALIFLWFAWGGISNAYDSYVSNKEIERLKKEADALREQVKTAEAEKEQYKGAAAAYKTQAETVTNELNELQTKQPQLAQRVEQARTRVTEARNQAERPIGNDTRERVDALGSKLDQLYK